VFGKVGVSEFAAALVEHGRREGLAVWVDADDVVCRHGGRLQNPCNGGDEPRDNIPVEEIDALIKSARFSVTAPRPTLQPEDSHQIEVVSEISFESDPGAVTHLRAAVAAPPVCTSPTLGSPC
jgi:hypothetical protein